MRGRIALSAAIILADSLTLLALRHAHLLPAPMSIARAIALYLPTALLAALGVSLALRLRLLTPPELGLGVTEFRRRHRLVERRYAAVLTALFVVAALTHALPPICAAVVEGWTHGELLAELRAHEWRDHFRHAGTVGVFALAYAFITRCVLSPVLEEIIFRALLIPAASPLGPHGAALVSGAVFHALHVYVYGYASEPSFFLVGWALAYTFIFLGLPAAILCHAGCNVGLYLLALYVHVWG